ncbi:DegT/DnrJ/EryC1/StrS family aminotransferase [Mahella sp.]|uniref:DegT/DnrJ/EryC1/StrS family aminotransferase n=1 Tax=Mahella sp. TaxID=2798721 RepID=UPI0025C660E8|nr:DegT/DnrJ/EryC1/StrS family aminotransferase [Mahella sp.]MBZ4664898.1 DegT/DnrJ/EryC1/StrS aminotransferase [Mahella sp.]
MNIPLLDLKGQYHAIKDEIDAAIEGVLENGQFILGPQVKALEHDIASYAGVPYAIGVGNGTDALVIALRACGIGPGDEVVTSPFTFFASAESISAVGAKPVFVDIDPDTFNIDVSKIEQAITSRTRAIIPVHLFGQIADMDAIMDIARKHDLMVIEDACQAMGAEYKGMKAGSFGHAACFSFFPTKNLGTYGDGGMIVTRDADIDKKARMLRAHGSVKKYYHEMIGYNSRLDELHAAILNVKFKYLDQWNDMRRHNAALYDELLKDSGVVTPYAAPYAKHIYHQYVVQCDDRDGLAEALKAEGISTGVYYPLPLHLQDAYKGLGYKKGDMPYAEAACNRVLALPMYPELERHQIKYVADAIKNYKVKG